MAWKHTYREGQIPPGGIINRLRPGSAIAKAVTEIQEKVVNAVNVQNGSDIIDVNAAISLNTLQISITDKPRANPEDEGERDGEDQDTGAGLPGGGAEGMYLRWSPDGQHYWDYVRAVEVP